MKKKLALKGSRIRRNMHIIEVIPRLYPCGGAETLLTSLSVAFKEELNQKVTVICLYSGNNENFLAKRLIGCGIQVYYLNKKVGVDFRCAKDLKKLVKRLKPDVIHLHLKTLLTAYLGGLAKIAPCFYTFHNTMNKLTRGSILSPENLFYRVLFRKRYFFPIAISKVVSESLKKPYGIVNPPIVYNGIPIEQYDFSVPWSQRTIDFIFIGRFTQIKNPLAIIKSFGQVSKKNQNINLIMLGIGPMFDVCDEYIRSNSLQNVKLLGLRSDANRYLADAKCLLLASSVEGNPMVINEAIACSTYVIATSVGGVPEILSNDGGALFEYNPGTLISDLAKEMEEFISTNHELEGKAKSAALKARKTISIDSKARQYLEIFQGTKR